MTRPEDALQRGMVEWLNLCVPPPPEGPYWTAVNPLPNKGKAQAGMSKAMGLRAGCPDFVFCINGWLPTGAGDRGRLIGIEVKPPGKTLSPVQRDAHTAITLSGGIVTTVHSIDELEGFLRGLGVPLRVADHPDCRVTVGADLG